jgi:putative ABC transport system substrate-binding protein
VKRLAVLYTPGEKNSESQLKELQGVQNAYGIKVLPVIVAKKEDVLQILPEVMNSVDAVFLSGSSVIGLNVQSIVDLANKSKVITITILEDLVKQGVMLGVGGDPYIFGAQSGKKAVAVLKGAKPSSIPIESPLKIEVLVNKKSARDAQVQIPKSVMQNVTKTFE